jgi:hypothetical protein
MATETKPQWHEIEKNPVIKIYTSSEQKLTELPYVLTSLAARINSAGLDAFAKDVAKTQPVVRPNPPWSGDIVKKMLVSGTFGVNERTAGYQIVLKPSAPIDMSLFDFGFIGCTVASIVDLRELHTKFGIVSGRMPSSNVQQRLKDELLWAGAHVNADRRNMYASIEAVFGRGESTTLKSELASHHDAAKWISGLDPSGMIGLYQEKDGDSSRGLLVVRCNTTPAAEWLAEHLKKSPLGHSVSYQTLIGSDAYDAVVDISERNAKRVLWKAATALGLKVSGTIDKSAIEVSSARGVSPPEKMLADLHQQIEVHKAVPSSHSTMAIRDMLTETLPGAPMCAAPDVMNMFNVFTLKKSEKMGQSFAHYFNSVVPVKGGFSYGGFVVFESAATGPIRLYADQAEDLHKVTFVDPNLSGEYLSDQLSDVCGHEDFIPIVTTL